MKQFLKAKLGELLPAVMRRFDLKSRTRILKASISNSNFIANIEQEERTELLVDCARAVKLAGFLHQGRLGTFCGLTRDENVHGRYLRSSDWSPTLNRFLREAVFTAERGTYIDVGANIGLTVVPIAKFKNVNCIALEPEPQNFRLLRANAILNGVEGNIAFHNLAAMSKPGEVLMKLSEWNLGDHQVTAFVGSAANQQDAMADGVVRVEAVRLDDLLDSATLAHPIACKIDTQGAEIEVILGAAKLMRAVDVLAIELWPFGLARLGGNAATLLELVKDFRFGALAKLDDSTQAKLSIAEPAELVLRRALALSTNAKDDEYWDLFLSKEPIPAPN